MILDVAKWLVDLWVKIWNMLYSTGGIIGGSIIVLFIMRKLVGLFRQFTN